jgi:hypothetical protein
MQQFTHSNSVHCFVSSFGSPGLAHPAGDLCITGLKNIFEILSKIRPRRITYKRSEFARLSEMNPQKLSAQKFFGLCRGLCGAVLIKSREFLNENMQICAAGMALYPRKNRV